MWGISMIPSNIMQHRPMNASEKSELDNFRQAGRNLLGIENYADDTLERADEFVIQMQRGPFDEAGNLLDEDKKIELSWSIGSLLGDHFVRHLGWAWSLVGIGDDKKFGIISANAALALYPSFFVRDCIEDASRDFTALLIFNMVSKGHFSDVREGSCLDLADNVIRIVPR